MVPFPCNNATEKGRSEIYWIYYDIIILVVVWHGKGWLFLGVAVRYALWIIKPGKIICWWEALGSSIYRTRVSWVFFFFGCRCISAIN